MSVLSVSAQGYSIKNHSKIHLYDLPLLPYLPPLPVLKAPGLAGFK